MELGSRILRGFDYARAGFERSDFHRKNKRVGAAYIEGNRIVIASNTSKSSPIAKKYGTRFDRLHAEMNCLQGLDDCSSGELFVYREHRDGTPAMARPCNYCIPLLQDRGCRHVYFSTETGYEYLDLRTLA